jgi:hypothetical protein
MHVLLLTEDTADRLLFKESMTGPCMGHSFTACESIAEVWAKLASCQMPLPNLIFVDFELSRDYDHRLVEVLKGFEEFKAAPVVIIAESAAQQDVEATGLLDVAYFAAFPREPELRREKIHACLEFWSTYAKLPQLRRWRNEG